MSAVAERTLVGLLTDVDSLKVLLREGFKPVVMPTEELVPVVTWAADYYSASGKAPTVTVVNERWGEVLADFDIDPAKEVEESIEWALEALEATYLKKVTAQFTRSLARAVASSDPEERLKVVAEHSSELSAIVAELTPLTAQVDMRGSQVLERYVERVEDPGTIRGMATGLDLVDAHYGGIHPGEIATFAAPAKMGKSFLVDFFGLNEWQRERPTALFTLENSIEMTEMRIAALATHVSLLDLQNGALSEAQEARLVEWVQDVLYASDTPLYVLQPPSGQRTPQALIQRAFALEVESVIVDQLTFVEPARPRKDQSRAYELAETMRMFKTLISAGRRQLPLALAHQIKREGIKEAERTGRLAMDGMADSSEVERASDHVFGLYGSADQIRQGVIELQGLASRRVPTTTFALNWQVGVGAIGVRNEVTEEDLEGFQ